jgi:beta-1,4-mannosyl-glycoprotein beta-1,4-N-acetylglucosaminyltransferase
MRGEKQWATDRPRVFDVFPFFEELDVLELRLNELAGVVDAFILIEAPWTHSGEPKPLHFQRHMHEPRFSPFLDRIVHVVVREAPVNGTSALGGNKDISVNVVSTDTSAVARRDAESLAREEHQRDVGAVRGLRAAGAAPSDFVVLADVDEARAQRPAFCESFPLWILTLDLAYNCVSNH